jgi:hypothetical protein
MSKRQRVEWGLWRRIAPYLDAYGLKTGLSFMAFRLRPSAGRRPC